MDHPSHSLFQGGLQDVLRTLDIDPDIVAPGCLGIVEQGGDVEHCIRSGKRGQEGIPVGYVSNRYGHARPIDCRGFRTGANKSYNLVPVVRKMTHEAGSDKSGCPGDGDPHVPDSGIREGEKAFS
jgi:hypothetical protein